MWTSNIIAVRNNHQNGTIIGYVCGSRDGSYHFVGNDGKSRDITYGEYLSMD